MRIFLGNILLAIILAKKIFQETQKVNRDYGFELKIKKTTKFLTGRKAFQLPLTLYEIPLSHNSFTAGRNRVPSPSLGNEKSSFMPSSSNNGNEASGSDVKSKPRSR